MPLVSLATHESAHTKPAETLAPTSLQFVAGLSKTKLQIGQSSSLEISPRKLASIPILRPCAA